MNTTAGQLAELLDGKLEGDPDLVITGVAKIEEARPGEITFLANPKYERYLTSTQATAVIVSETQRAKNACLIRVPDPYQAFAKLLQFFQSSEKPPAKGIHPTAHLGENVTLGRAVCIGPQVVIGDRCKIGDEVLIFPGAVIGDDVTIGGQTVIHTGVSIRFGVQIGSRVCIQDNTVIGSEGFGFAPSEDGGYEKIPQVGTVVIEDEVEIGAGCTIDRATLGATRIGKGTKLDNLIQVAHNVVIGANTVIAAQTGISGSTKIGAHCMIGGQVGFVGHITLGKGSMVGAQSGISRSFPPGSKLFGYPAQDHHEQLRIQAHLKKLPELVKQVNRLEKIIAESRTGNNEK